MQKAKSVLNIVIRAASIASQQVPVQHGTIRKLLVSTSSGFPKDLRFGVSTVLRKDGYGEDAYFIAHNRLADVLGVADGVGGWRDHGVDPSVFSRGLMRHCARLVREGKFSPQNPERLIAASYSELIAQASFSSEPLLGSSTACIVILDRDNSRIYTANLGDSGFLVFRNGRVVHRSEEQTHYFNTPFQLSLPPQTDAGQYLSDSPESAEITTFSVKEGDLILVATDGLFDNMPVNLIEKEISQLKDFDQQSLQMACNSIALQARTLAFDKNHMSPFAKKANQYGYEATGGKPDDITVILAVVSTSPTPPSTGSHQTDSYQTRSNGSRT